MDKNDSVTDHDPRKGFHVVGLNYVSLYVLDYEAAISFYSRVFGPPETADKKAGIHGWRMGATWLTLFPAAIGTHADSNPRNCEFAIQVSQPQEVDALHSALLSAGALPGWAPEDTSMYEPMRFAYVEDPFGARIDIYCPISPASE